MNFDFEKIKKTISVTARKAKKISENTIETTKLKLKLSDLKSDIKEKYTEIGRVVYECAEDDNCTERVDQLCREISALRSEMDDINQTLNDLTNVKNCPECGSDIKKDCLFCPKCGHEFKDA